MAEPYELLRVCVLGHAKVGKSRLVKQFAEEPITPESPSFFPEQKNYKSLKYGSDFFVTERNSENQRYKVQATELGSLNEPSANSKLSENQHCFIVVVKLENNDNFQEKIANTLNSFSHCFKSSPNASIIVALNQFRGPLMDNLPHRQTFTGFIFNHLFARFQGIIPCNANTGENAQLVLDTAIEAAKKEQKRVSQSAAVDENTRLLQEERVKTKRQENCCAARCSMM